MNQPTDSDSDDISTHITRTAIGSVRSMVANGKPIYYSVNDVARAISNSITWSLDAFFTKEHIMKLLREEIDTIDSQLQEQNLEPIDSKRFEQVANDGVERAKRYEQEANAKIEEVEQRIDDVEDKIDNMTKELTRLKEELSVHGRIKRNAEEYREQLTQRLEHIKKRRTE